MRKHLGVGEMLGGPAGLHLVFWRLLTLESSFSHPFESASRIGTLLWQGMLGKGATKGFLVWLHLGSLRTASLEFAVEFSGSPDSIL